MAKVKVPMLESFSSVGMVSSEYPDLLFELQSFVPLSKGQFTMNVRVTNFKEVGEALSLWRSSPLVESLEVLSRTSHSLLVALTQRSPEKSAIRVVVRNNVVPMLPVQVKGGEMVAVVVTSAEKLRRVYEDLKQVSPQTTIESIRPEQVHSMESLLTPHQAKVFKVAKAAGYWEVPRRASLAEIAKTLNLSKSAVSETLSLIEKKLVDEATPRT